MKRIMAAAMVVVLTGFSVQAGAAGLYGGVKGGVNWASVSGDNKPDNTSSRTGFTGGAFFGSEINEQFGVRGEILYVQKGVKGDFTEGSNTYAGTLKVDYIDIPLEFVFNAVSGEKVGVNIFGGPSLNFKTSAKIDVDGVGEGDVEGAKGFEFGAVIGGGVAYKLSSVSLLADVRYSLGATSIFEDVSGQSVDVKNSGVGVMAGLSFPLGGK